jgi:hypothetical protein
MSPSKAASKTKLQATRNKVVVRPKITTKDGKEMTPEQRFLAKLMDRYAESEGDAEKGAASFCDIMGEFGMNNRNTGQRKVWASMIETKHYIERVAGGKGTSLFTYECKLTQAGLEAAAAEGMELSIPSGTPTTNKELHERIKSKCMNNRGHDIFDLLLKKGPLTRKELAEQELKISNRGAYFSYALQQLKDLGYVERDPSASNKAKLRLSDKCFVVSTDREDFLLEN